MTQTPDPTPETPRVPSISLSHSDDADGAAPAQDEAAEQGEAVVSPAKVLRIGSMVRQLLEEVRNAPLDEAGRTRLREIYDISIRELASGLSPDLAAELNRVVLPLEGAAPSEAELRVAQAQLVGWLEGLFHGIQAALFAQQAVARNQLAEMRGRGLPGPVPNRDQDRTPGEGLYL
jgi:hypothetical protein